MLPSTQPRPWPKEEPVELCQNCKFWRRADYNGMCKRHAPAPHPGQHNSAAWPWTNQFDWCGDFEHKQEPR